MNWIVDNWYVLIAFLCIGAVAGIAVYRFIKIPTSEQLDKVREWLLLAVTEAEKAMGGGTGRLKLRMVYGMFIDKFPWLVKVVSFEQFSAMVDEALEQMREMLTNNEAVKEFVEQ